MQQLKKIAEEKLPDLNTSNIDQAAKIIAGTGSNCTKTAIEMTQKAADIGVDGTLQVTPYYNKPSQDGIKRHIESIAAATSLPIMLYNIPSRTGTIMSPATISTLTALDTVVALKEAGGSIDQFKAIQAVVPPSFALYSGDDGLTFNFLQAGAIGVVSVASHLVGNAIQAMIHAFVSNDLNQAETIATELLPLFNILFITSNPSPVKYALTLQGFQTGIPRLPLLSPSQIEMEQIEAVLSTPTIQKYLKFKP